MTTKAQLAYQEELRGLLTTNDKAVCRAVVAIWHKQTDAEKDVQQTKDHNGVGFNSVDSVILSSFAEQIIRNHGLGRPKLLTDKQMEYARKKIIKYAGQLAVIAEEKGRKTCASAES